MGGNNYSALTNKFNVTSIMENSRNALDYCRVEEVRPLEAP